MSAVGVLLVVGAFAAEVTDLAPEMGVVASLGYTGSAVSGRLVEAGQTVGGRRIGRHDLDLAAEFSPVRGLAVTLDLVYTPSLVFRYPLAREMIIEPLSGSGSYLTGELSAETPTVRASGLDGLWVGVAASPISEAYGNDQRATWRLDAGLRTPSRGRNLWTAPNGRRGAATGSSAFRLAGAFSTERGVSSPWLRAEWVHESQVKVDVIDEAGVQWATDLPLRPASTFTTDIGVELLAFRDPDTGTETAIDLWLGAGYRSWEDIATGVYLPNVLDGARSIPVTTGDTVTARAGAAVNVHAGERVRVRGGLTLGYRVPYRLEHVYDVRTSGDTFELGWSLVFSGVGSLDGDAVR